MAGLRRKPIEYDAADGLPPARLWVEMPPAHRVAALLAVLQAPPIMGDGPEPDAERDSRATELKAATVELATAAVYRWDDVTDDNGAQVPCTPDAREEFMTNHADAATAVTAEVNRLLGARAERGKGFGAGSASVSVPTTAGSPADGSETTMARSSDARP